MIISQRASRALGLGGGSLFVIVDDDDQQLVRNFAARAVAKSLNEKPFRPGAARTILLLDVGPFVLDIWLELIVNNADLTARRAERTGSNKGVSSP